jgi:hypothetical protein
MSDNLEAQRLRQFSISLSDQSDTYAMEGYGDIAARMSDPVVKTQQGAGYLSLSSPFLSAAGDDLVPLAECLDLAANLPACVVRASIAGWPVFFGRVWTFHVGQAKRTSRGLAVPLTIQCNGAYGDYTGVMADPEDDYTDDDANMSASEVLRRLTSQQRRRYNLVQSAGRFIIDTSRNVAPIPVNDGTRLQDVLSEALKGGSIDPDDQEFLFLVYDGFPILKPRINPPDWYQDLEASGMGWTLDMERFASDVVVMWTDRDGNTQGNEVITNTPATERWHGFERSGAITLSGVNQDGADGGGLAYLLRQEIPIAFDGSVTIQPEPGQLWGQMEGSEHAPTPVYMVRAGDNVGITGLMPHETALLPEPLRVFNVNDTELNVRTGTLIYNPDRLTIVGRLNENPALLRGWLAATEPARAKGLDIRVEKTTAQDIHGKGNKRPDMDPPIVFRPPRVMTVTIRVEMQISGSTDQDIWFGWRFNDDAFNLSDKKHSRYERFRTGANQQKHASFQTVVYPGRTYTLWGCAVDDSGGTSAETWAISIKG